MCHLTTNRQHGDVQTTLEIQRLNTLQGAVGVVGVHGEHTTVVASVHRFQNRDHLWAARLAQQNTLGAHTQTVAHIVSHCHSLDAFAFFAGDQTHPVRQVRQLQFWRIFYCDHTFNWVNVVSHRGQESGFTRTSTARHRDVQLCLHACAQKVARLGCQRTQLHQIVKVARYAAETTNRDHDRTHAQVGHKRIHDHMYTAAVAQTVVAIRHTHGHAAPTRTIVQLIIDKQPQRILAAEMTVNTFDRTTTALDKDVFVTVDEDFFHVRVRHIRCNRPPAQHIIRHTAGDAFGFSSRLTLRAFYQQGQPA